MIEGEVNVFTQNKILGKNMYTVLNSGSIFSSKNPNVHNSAQSYKISKKEIFTRQNLHQF